MSAHEVEAFKYAPTEEELSKCADYAKVIIQAAKSATREYIKIVDREGP